MTYISISNMELKGDTSSIIREQAYTLLKEHYKESFDFNKTSDYLL